MGLREQREQFDRAASMPHRNHAGDNRLDARLESRLGRLYFDGQITEPEYEAGARYATIALLWLESSEAPDPYGSDDFIRDGECMRRHLAMSQARTILKKCGNRCWIAVNRVAVYDEPHD